MNDNKQHLCAEARALAGGQQQSRVIFPGATIGILGGGQLGRMIALAAREMGYRILTLDPAKDSPCGQVADREFVGAFNDVELARAMAAACDVVTYEFENVDSEVVRELESFYHFPQGSKILHLSRHRLREKTALQEHGIPVTPFVPVRNEADLRRGLDSLGFPCVLKTATGGYDGKGQWVIRSAQDTAQLITMLNGQAQAQAQSREQEYILEKWLTFRCELSVIVARNPAGEQVTFPVAENIHRENILHMSIVPARVAEETKEKARELALRIAEKLNLTGLLAVEMFLGEDGQLYVNELAPRPHNSGHYTQDACLTSQFEQHVRAVCNLPLGKTDLHTPVVMVNILGEHVQPVLRQLPRMDQRVKVHFYGKAEARPIRKMGHLNVLAASTEEALAIIKKLGIWN